MTYRDIWLLIDGTNVIHRDAHGCGIGRAIENFRARMPLLIERLRPALVACAWDNGDSFRKVIHPIYKAGRVKLPGIDDVIREAKSVCIEMGIGNFTADGFEADDILATFTRSAIESDSKAVIYSTDKDIHQLLAKNRVCQMTYVSRVKDSIVCTFCNASDVEKRFGVTPSQFIDYRILVGDVSDKISGIPGIGPDAAKKVVRSCGSLDGFFEEPFRPAISDRQRQLILNSREAIDNVLRPLVTLRSDVPLPADWLEAC